MKQLKSLPGMPLPAGSGAAVSHVSCCPSAVAGCRWQVHRLDGKVVTSRFSRWINGSSPERQIVWMVPYGDMVTCS